MKTSKDYMTEADAVVPRLTPEEGIAAHKKGGLFIDVRDSGEIAQTGTIQGALRIPRGLIEFVADDESPLHNEALSKDADIFVVCGAGGMAALTGKTLKDMGYKSVANVGGFGGWKEAGGPTES